MIWYDELVIRRKKKEIRVYGRASNGYSLVVWLYILHYPQIEISEKWVVFSEKH